MSNQESYSHNAPAQQQPAQIPHNQDTFVPMNLSNQQPTPVQAPPTSTTSVPAPAPGSVPAPNIPQQPMHAIPDTSNPYNYPHNPYGDGSTPGYGHTPSTASHAAPLHSDTDPQLKKMTSSWSYATGLMQEQLGSMIGNDDWTSSGRAAKEKANQEWSEADNLRKSGVPSRLGGEYESIMGTIMQKVGYVAGDPEMEAKAALRAQQGREEVARSSGHT